MSPDRNKSKSSLVIFLAKGGSVAAWCRQSEVPVRTARRWVAEPKFKARVESARNRMYAKSLGILAASVAEMARGMVRLGKSAQAEAVRLQAQRAVFVELRDGSDFLTLRRRLAEIEARLDDDDRKPAVED